MADELKPCPFCGTSGNAHVYRNSDVEFYVACIGPRVGSCGATHYGSTRDKAIERWNTRHQPNGGAVAEDARDAARLDFIERNRVALIPEYEGPWDAEVYGDEGAALGVGSGTTPRAAIDAAMSDQNKGKE